METPPFSKSQCFAGILDETKGFPDDGESFTMTPAKTRRHAHELEENIERRAGGVLEGVAYRVADNAGLMGIGALSAVVPFSMYSSRYPMRRRIVEHTGERETGGK